MLQGTGQAGTVPARSSRAGAKREISSAERRDLVARVSGLSLAGLGRPRVVDPGGLLEALVVARAWLGLVDDGHFAVSWNAAGPGFKDVVPEGDWAAAVRAVRVPLGRSLARRVRSMTACEGLPGDPESPCVVTRFESAFERRGGVVETVAASLGTDDSWRVAAYFIE